MKGKKFNAAEKHFKEKEVQYRQQINKLNDQLQSRHVLIAELDHENGDLQRQNEKLLKEIEYLKDLYGLSEEEKAEYMRNVRSYANFGEMIKVLEKKMINYI
jgi:predicted RNase H-like nuclease (RuvC/YqgF family)